MGTIEEKFKEYVLKKEQRIAELAEQNDGIKMLDKYRGYLGAFLRLFDESAPIPLTKDDSDKQIIHNLLVNKGYMRYWVVDIMKEMGRDMSELSNKIPQDSVSITGADISGLKGQDLTLNSEQ